MLLQLIRNEPSGSAITGRLVVNGRWFCNTLERKGYEILPLCYAVRVTQSPKFKRLLPLVCGVPQRSGIRFHRGSKPEHSTGCILVLGDQIKQPKQPNNNLLREKPTEELLKRVVDVVVTTAPVVGTRSSAEVENQLTQMLLKAQEYEEIILEVTEYKPGTPDGYDTPCPPVLQKR